MVRIATAHIIHIGEIAIYDSDVWDAQVLLEDRGRMARRIRDVPVQKSDGVSNIPPEPYDLTGFRRHKAL